MMWRNSSLQPKFFIFDGMIFVPLIVFAVHASKVTFGILIASAVILLILNRRGITFRIMFYAARRYVVGNYRPVPISIRTYRRRARW